MSVLEESKWYVLQTYAGYEDKVASNIMIVAKTHNLDSLISEIKVPREEVREFKNGKEEIKMRKVYPGYVFIKVVLTSEIISRVIGVRGCSGFVGNPPTPLSHEETEKFGLKMPVKLELPYDIGDNVQIIEETLSGVSGVVKSIDTKKQLVSVVVSMFGRETTVELRLEDVIPVDKLDSLPTRDKT